MTRDTNKRAGFTLIELMVVIGILLILATLAFAVFNANRSSDRMRSAARVAQSAFLGAKDRALHAKDLRGLRLTRDQTDTTLVNGFVYLQPIPNLIYGSGSIQLERHSLTGPPAPGAQKGDADSPDVIYVRGFNPQYATYPTVDFFVKSQFFASPGRIRIPAGTGQWYNFTLDTSGPYVPSQSNEYLHLSSPFIGSGSGNPSPAVVAFDQNSGFSSCEIQLYNEVLPFHSPISLSSAVVIDLKFSSPNVIAISQASATPQPSPLPFIDIMFSPRGMVTGPLAAQGPLHFLMRDLQDATATSAFTDASGKVCGGLIVGPDPRSGAANQWGTADPNKGDRMILTVFPQTGLVQAFEIDQTDNLTNGTNAGPPDGLADDLFAFAKSGKSAGR